MRIMTKNQALDYIREHAVPAGGKWHSNFWRITKEMKVFKKAYDKDYSQVIVNLVIPVGAIIHFPEDNYSAYCIDARKMRASKAFVHSIASKNNKESLNVAYSDWDSNFKYAVGKTVKPTSSFCSTPHQCEPGIHFFMQLEDALIYS